MFIGCRRLHARFPRLSGAVRTKEAFEENIVAVLAPVTFVMAAFAALRSESETERSTVETGGLAQLAAGTQRRDQHKQGESDRGSMKGGKSTYSARWL